MSNVKGNNLIFEIRYANVNTFKCYTSGNLNPGTFGKSWCSL